MKTLGKPLLIAAGGIALLALVSMLWSWYRPGPTAALVNAARPKPAPVRAKPTRAAEKAEPQVITREVVRYLPAPKEKKRLEEKYQVKIGEGPEERDLLAEVELPRLPAGGTAAVTVGESGKAEVTVLAKPLPFFELGGIRESGVSFDPLRGAAGVYHEQDLMRTGKVVWGLRAFATAALANCLAPPCQEDVNYGAEVRAGIRW